MPTVTVATNAHTEGTAMPTLIESMTDVLAPIAEVPREYVHIHVVGSQFMSFGGDPITPCCQVRAPTRVPRPGAGSEPLDRGLRSPEGGYALLLHVTPEPQSIAASYPDAAALRCNKRRSQL